ncbi:hypothetical protein [Flavobacterium luteum]|uniref:Uncharacterized protein n=1 Tax=Flavobacterium luteum TaxID=2026654 RepID=A0A7J5AE09_9FLAO|nr:hypothetical protein [Flavobacterium luteum]KAB1155775.1 hypothetical protein F6464_09635 [Flavobacterium luteum]
MLKAVLFISNKKQISLSNRIENGKSIYLHPQLEINNNESFDLQFTFNDEIVKFRNHDYTWVEILKDDIVANQFTPKIIQLKNGFFIQANINFGIWEIKSNDNKTLFWRFNPENSNSFTSFSKNADKSITQARTINKFLVLPQLLFTKGSTIEFSRSKIPFTAIACFTDHCDFDTPENLETQRLFFAKHKIKVTKGFFLNHFSKRNDNASFENESHEFLKWIDDGHELAYHSLSQSLKIREESIKDFKSFKPPLPSIPVWIDHGYQPYNFSVYKNHNLSDENYENNLMEKKIKILWNYIDSGTATLGVINQLNSNDFTLNSFYKGSKSLKLKERLGTLIKNMTIHYYANQKIIKQYRNVAISFKSVFLERKLNYLFKFIVSLFGIAFPILKVFFTWHKSKKIPYKQAKYSSLFFKHKINQNDFYIFQTLKMVDFKASLCETNIEKLVAEKGVFIAHTYFSLPMTYHKGKMFKTITTIDEAVDENFGLLAQKVVNQEIWNPTLSELINYLSKLEEVVLDIDENENVYISQNSGVAFRNVN